MTLKKANLEDVFIALTENNTDDINRAEGADDIEFTESEANGE